MRDTVLMGQSGCGKTTLIQALSGEELRYAKTQTVERKLHFIDTPGEYMERRMYYRALIVTSADAELIGLVQDVGRETSWIPPAFAATFAKPVFGIVSKIDLATSAADIAHAREALLAADADPIFEVSAVTGAGMRELWEFLNADDVYVGRNGLEPFPTRGRSVKPGLGFPADADSTPMEVSA